MVKSSRCLIFNPKKQKLTGPWISVPSRNLSLNEQIILLTPSVLPAINISSATFTRNIIGLGGEEVVESANSWGTWCAKMSPNTTSRLSDWHCHLTIKLISPYGSTSKSRSTLPKSKLSRGGTLWTLRSVFQFAREQVLYAFCTGTIYVARPMRAVYELLEKGKLNRLSGAY